MMPLVLKPCLVCGSAVIALYMPPVGKNSSVFAFGMGMRIAVAAVIFTAVSLLGYFIGSQLPIGGIEESHAVGRTMAYVILAYASVVNIMNVRSFNKSIFTIGFTSNKLLFGGICLSFTLIAVTALLPTFGNETNMFYCVPLSVYHWIIMLSLAVTPFAAVEILKVFVRKRLKAANA